MPNARPMAFETAKQWASWLKANHKTAEGLWIRFFKKASGVTSVSYAQALDEALCWGWIDGQLKAFNAQSWLRRFTPRAPKSQWSKRNREHVVRLKAAGRMRAPGLAQVKAAQADGRWHRAYAAPSEAVVPQDFLEALAKDKAAEAFFETLNKANRYAIAYRLETAKKPETRRRRFALLVAMMKEQRKLH